MSTLYFALQPDMDASEEILDVARNLAFEYDLADPYGAEQLHLKLNSVGSFNLDLVDRAIAAGDSIWASSVNVTLDRICAYGGDPTPLVLMASETDPLRRLFGKLAESMARNGLASPSMFSPSIFSPHVTMLTDNRAPVQAPLANPISWIANEFALIHSDAFHEVVATWPLR